MSSIDSLRVFIRTVELGSLSAAGRALGLSPPSVSRIIRALEEEAGVRLLNRTSRKLALTHVGEAYLRKSREVLESYDGLKDVLAEAGEEPKGLLTVHSRISVGKYFLLGAVPDFLRAYPRIDLRLWLSEDVRDLVDNRIDVALRLGRPSETTFAMRKLSAGVKMVLFASPTYLENSSPIRAPHDLLQHSCLTGLREGGPDGGTGIWRYREGGRSHELRVRGRLQATDGWTIRDAVVAGLGVGLLPGWMIHDQLRAGAVVPILEDVDITALSFDQGVYAVFQKSPRVSPHARAFIDFLVRTFRTFDPRVAEIGSSEEDLANQ
ncbi:LysR family transcriptional regulator [Rhizobium leguminosarum]|uniref:LysR family transcriptional regulator n=1 Tax=Rhizobium leguminosarum TaxID=384 RepID=UPI001C96BFDC|nr:LysR family transcriptional regulator [Rhizobium leguminosarum]MBY5377294.1 LysR family transcriptional regulator [Rhizobium leguminosarum]